MTDKMVEAYLKALGNEERAAATVEKYRRALLSFATFLSGAAVTPRDDSALEGRPAREKLRAVDDQHLFSGAERLFPFLRLGRLPRTVSQDPAPPVPRQQTGVNASRV